MRKNPYGAKFIVFEGLDGSGKSTQANLLVDFLRNTLHRNAYYTAEPTTGLIGGIIRSQIGGDWKSSNECLQLLFSADRLYHLEKEVIPMLEQGIDVVSDRYFFSTLAYGGTTPEDIDWLLRVNDRIILPDIVFLLRISAKVGMERIHTNRHEIKLFDREEFLTKVEGNYDTLAQQFHDITVVIDGQQAIDKVAEDIRSMITQKLK